jgi:hypothetical protein
MYKYILIHNPYTGFLPTETLNGFLGDLSVDKVKHKRYTMRDIAGLENRINQVEYYTALSSLEQNALLFVDSEPEKNP